MLRKLYTEWKGHLEIFSLPKAKVTENSTEMFLLRENSRWVPLKYDKYALKLWIFTEHKFYKAKEKCIPSACESVYREIFVSHRVRP